MSITFQELNGLISCRLFPTTLKGILGSSSIDTRTLRKGELFWALKTEFADGHDFIYDAFLKGAQAAVVRKDWFKDHRDSFPGRSFIIVSDPLTALQNLAANHRRRFRIPVIALTGSNGKTATKELLGEALNLRYNVLKSQGNYNNYIGIPLTLLNIQPETEIVILEMGTNQPGDIELLCSIAQPDVGMVLNIGPAHLEGFSDVDGVAKEKSILLQSLPPHGTAFINCDDPIVRRMKTTAGTLICYGFQVNLAKTECCKMQVAENLGLTPEGKGCFRLRNVTFTLGWYGEHQIKNALAAVAIADRFGVPLEEIAKAFASLLPMEGRLNVLYYSGITLIDDTYNANPASTAAALDFVRSLNVKGRRFVVLGDHLELGAASEEQHRFLGKLIAEKGFNGAFLIGPQMQFARDAIPEMTLYYQEDNADLSLIIQEIKKAVRPGDAVLIKASRGMKLERIVRKLRQQFAENSG